MTDKQLQKLGRRELLQMLLEQAKETERLSQELAETSAQLRQLEETYERLRQRLDSKDAQIHELKTTLQAEREKRDVELQEAGSIAEAALTLNGVFDAAQKAADLYLEQVRALHPAPDGTMPPELASEETPESPAAPQPPVRPAPPPSRDEAEEDALEEYEPEERPAPPRRPAKKPAPSKRPPKRLASNGRKSKPKTEWRFFFGVQRDESDEL